ncbi:uncharacterized protein LOC120118068 [Hibiscus syriacus]|uniref:uncharacterized protein LOC120118068 n=1 Tax=Hibiscus syriacus TaxID=106335 RepID=UPI001924F2C8|nr:uncharacterized protein LOC120118068 [Hibiscus syriacus]
MANHYYHQSNVIAVSTPSTSLNSLSPLLLRGNHSFFRNKKIALERSLVFERKSTGSLRKNRGGEYAVVVASSGNVAASDLWDSWKPQKNYSAPSLSGILWPSAGAYAAMAILGKMDQILAPKGISMTIAPLGAVCAVLFASLCTFCLNLLNASHFRLKPLKARNYYINLFYSVVYDSNHR